jgi:DNA-binding protein HU-beta
MAEKKQNSSVADKKQNSARSSGRSGYGKTSLIEEVTAHTQGYSRRQVAEILEAALDTIQQKVASGQNVTLTGFGTFRRSQRAARMGTNIRTREKIKIPAQTSVRFTPGSEFKTVVGGSGSSSGSSSSKRRS